MASEMSNSEISVKVSGQGNSRKSTSTGSTTDSDDHMDDCQDGSTIVDQKMRTIRKKWKTEMVKVEGGSDESNNCCVDNAIRDYGNSQMKAEVAKNRDSITCRTKMPDCWEKVLLDTWEQSNNICLS
jgi:hypothetical protein